MDFGGLLGKEIERKRKKAKSKSVLKKHKPELQVELLENSKPEEHAIQPTVDPLLSINDAKLQESLQSLDKSHEEKLSKEEQLRTLEILVKQKRKNTQYQNYLEEETSVPDILTPEDVAQVSDEKIYRKLCLQVRKFIKVSLKMWEDNSDDKFTMPLLLETKKDVVKLMYKLRSGKLRPEMVITLSTIVHDIQTEKFTKANESYMKLSIGNVAWPIGVRDVGIHARSADKKITGDDKSQVANIMKSEHTRRWIIAVKRIINWWEHWYIASRDSP